MLKLDLGLSRWLLRLALHDIRGKVSCARWTKPRSWEKNTYVPGRFSWQCPSVLGAYLIGKFHQSLVGYRGNAPNHVVWVFGIHKTFALTCKELTPQSFNDLPVLDQFWGPSIFFLTHTESTVAHIPMLSHRLPPCQMKSPESCSANGPAKPRASSWRFLTRRIRRLPRTARGALGQNCWPKWRKTRWPIQR